MTTLLARSFGGKSGTWFRKRKLKEEGESNAPRTTSIILFNLTGKSQSRRKVKKSRLSETERGERVVVSWDDVLCRPIYKHIQEDESRNIKKAESEAKPSLQRAASEEPKDQPKNNGNSKISSHQNPSPPVRKRCYGKSRKEPIVSTEELDIYTERIVVASRVPMTNDNEEKHSCNCNVDDDGPHEHDKSDERDCAFGFQEGDIVETQGSEQPKKFHTPKIVKSVSSKTSLSVAKQFFLKLDSQHNLTLSQEASISPQTRKMAGRTTRSVSTLTTRILAEEYSEYKAACETSAVTPLPKKSYIKNRSSFFRSNTIYDGFLDE